jgi:hypothetical protein
VIRQSLNQFNHQVYEFQTQAKPAKEWEYGDGKTAKDPEKRTGRRFD